MFPVELTPKIVETSMTTSDPFSIIFVKKHTSTVRYISTSTDALLYSYDGFHFKLQIRSVFDPKVGTFLTIMTFSLLHSGYRAKSKERTIYMRIFSISTVALN